MLLVLDIKDFLQAYYEYSCDIIVEFGGVVEKLIGDAVVAVFGAPFEFYTLNENFFNACTASQRIIEKTHQFFDGEFQSKCSLSRGDCYFGFIGNSNHKELSMVGNPLTTLFRLENDCPKDSIIMTTDNFRTVKDRFNFTTGLSKPHWAYSLNTLKNVKGMGDVDVFVLTYVT